VRQAWQKAETKNFPILIVEGTKLSRLRPAVETEWVWIARAHNVNGGADAWAIRSAPTGARLLSCYARVAAKRRPLWDCANRVVIGGGVFQGIAMIVERVLARVRCLGTAGITGLVDQYIFLELWSSNGRGARNFHSLLRITIFDFIKFLGAFLDVYANPATRTVEKWP